MNTNIFVKHRPSENAQDERDIIKTLLQSTSGYLLAEEVKGGFVLFENKFTKNVWKFKLQPAIGG